MKKVKSLYLKNFQSHLETRVDFDPNITVFIGETDSGKTSMFRMIDLIVNNSLRSTGFITVGQTKTQGILTLEDDVEVVRERSKSLNRYAIYNPDGTSLNFEGFGTDVPPDVSEALGYQSIYIDSDLSIDLNFSKQLAGHFLITESNSNKAKIIDGLARINVFNIALRTRNNELASMNIVIRGLEKDIKEKQEALEEFSDLEEMEKTLMELDAAILQLEQLEARQQELITTRNNYQQVMNGIKENEYFVKELSRVKDADILVQHSILLSQKKNMLQSFSENHKTVINGIKEAEMIIARKGQIEELETTVKELENLLQKSHQYSQLNQEYKNASSSIHKGTQYVSRFQTINEADNYISQVTDLLNRRNELVGLRSRVRETDYSIQGEQSAVGQLKSISEAEGLIQSLTEKVSRKTELVSLRNGLFHCNHSISETNNIISEAKKNISFETQRYSDSLKAFNKCPVCFSDLSDEHLEHVARSL